jgi:formylglycine-generating enzyme required for sulfatase activity
MKRMQGWQALAAAVLLAIGVTAGRAQESLFARIVSPTNSAITHFGADGTLVWTNGATGVTCTVQRAATLTGQSNWVDYAVCVATNTTMTAFVRGMLYMVVDLSGGSSAESYPVTYLGAVPPGGWTDEHKTTKLVLRRIPATTPDFTMGSPDGELGRDSDETQHQVTLTSDFYLGVFEVTQRQWELVMGNKPSYFNNATYYQTRPVELVSYFDIREDPNNSDDPAVDWPVNSAVNANSFMGKLRAKTGLSGFDLPTESQWEYACRAGTMTALNSGYNLTSTNSDPRMDVVGRYLHNGGSAYSQDCAPSAGTAAVGSYLANAWGLYDMHGNVWEGCLDWYDAYPGMVSDPKGPTSGKYEESRVDRGGCWVNDALNCRSAYRIYDAPSGQYADSGFRACCAPPGQQ